MGEDTGILDINDQVVADLGHNVTQGLGKDDIHHCLDVSHSNSLGALCLSLVDREDSASHRLCHIRAGIDGDDQDGGEPHGHIDLEQIGTSEIDKHGLRHHGGPAEKFHITCHDKLNDLHNHPLGRGIILIGRDRLDDTHHESDDASKQSSHNSPATG